MENWVTVRPAVSHAVLDPTLGRGHHLARHNEKSKQGDTMALITCPDCGKEVSDRAAACNGCGAPLGVDAEARGSGVRSLTTTQLTSKSLKIQSLIAVVMFLVGMVMAMATDPAEGESGVGIASLLMVVGVLLYIVTRFRIWWHHK